MSDSSFFEQLFLLVGIVVLLTLFVGQALGQPVLLSYVETESMSPTLEPGDGFLPVPTQLTGPPEEGDVITFEAQELHGGGLTTHRVVGKTEQGYITQGDGNPFADQDNEEPPVKQPQIKAVAFELNGRVVVVPQIGAGIEAIQSVLETIQQRLDSLLGGRTQTSPQAIGIAVFIASLLWYLVGGSSENREGRTSRDRSRETGINTQLIVAGCGLLLVLTATAAMVVPGGSHEYGVVSASFESDRPDVIPQGESNRVSYPVDNRGFVPIVSYIEPASKGVAVEPQSLSIPPRTLGNTTVRLDAPAETGYYRRYVVEHRYLAVLPTPIIEELYEAHPWLPIVVIDLLIGGLSYTLGTRLVSGGRIRDRSRDEEGFRLSLQQLLPTDD